MPLYNKEQYVERAIRSVLAQSVGDFELIVINDGSTDKGPDNVRAFADERIRVINQPNEGVSAARNRGIAESRSDLVAFLDADDEWASDYLKMVLHLQRKFPTCQVFATNYLICRNNGDQLKVVIKLPFAFEEGILHDYFSVASVSDPPLWTSAVSVRKEAIDSIGGFPVDLTAGEDLLTWARLAVRYRIAYTKRVCAFYYSPADANDRPDRIPQHPDLVGKELVHLFNISDPSMAGSLRRYVSLWFKMRAVTYMQLGDRLKALSEIRKSASYFLGLKVIVLYFLFLMPRAISFNVYSLIKAFKTTKV